MTIAVWIASGLLALINLAVGAMKLARPKDTLAAMGPQFSWTGGFSQTQIRLIAVAELLAAVGMILPPLTGILPILAPLAALGVVVLQIGAIITHLRRKEAIVINVVVVVLALFVAIGRFAGF